MTSAQSFCYAALLNAPDRVSDIFSFLVEARRSEIQSALNELRDAPEAELRRGWMKNREKEAKQQLQITVRRTGLPISEFSPGLQRWFCSGSKFRS